jgi:HlyD family secretion protein
VRERCLKDLAAEQGELATLEKRLGDWNESNDRENKASMALVLLSQLRSQREKTSSASQRCDAVGAVLERSAVKFPVDASVVEITVSAGAHVREGDVLATLLPATARIVGYLALGEQYRSEVSPGLPVRVKFDALPYDEVGVGRARVVRLVEALPSGVKIESAPSASVFVELDLDAMPAGSGPPRTGMTFTADVLTRQRRVLSLLFGTSEP